MVTAPTIARSVHAYLRDPQKRRIIDKLRQAGDASRRAGRRVGSFARNHPVATGAIGLGSAAVLGGAIMLARRRRAMKNAEEAVEEGTKASVKSRRRPAKR